uniref:threonine--tRNA ligase n=1 Tax=Kalanchoe fedtschenkoi TaxID=63787 RepID=A0A7N0TF49_KALFE
MRCAQIGGLCTVFLRRQTSSSIHHHHLRLLPHLSTRPVSSATSAMAVSNQKDQAYLDAVIEKRISMFKQIQQAQDEQRQAMSGDPIKITMPDGSVKEGKKWQSRPFDIALEIAKSLASNSLISQVNGVLWDMYRPLEGDCELKFFNFDTDEGRDTFWHSSAHILGEVDSLVSLVS